MGFLMPSAPKPPTLPLPPPSAHPATLGSAQIALANQASKSAAGAAAGMGADGTIKTSPGGLEPAKTAKTLLG